MDILVLVLLLTQRMYLLIYTTGLPKRCGAGPCTLGRSVFCMKQEQPWSRATDKYITANSALPQRDWALHGVAVKEVQQKISCLNLLLWGQNPGGHRVKLNYALFPQFHPWSATPWKKVISYMYKLRPQHVDVLSLSLLFPSDPCRSKLGDALPPCLVTIFLSTPCSELTLAGKLLRNLVFVLSTLTVAPWRVPPLCRPLCAKERKGFANA